MEKVHLRPRPGIRVRTPDGALLPEAGKAFELNSYWRRRIADGDVLTGAPPAAPADKPSGKR